jgi:hypothetical protein
LISKAEKEENANVRNYNNTKKKKNTENTTAT